MGTALVSRIKSNAETRSIRISNTIALAVGEYVAINDAGDLIEVADADGNRPVGFVASFSVRDTGVTDTGDTAATPPPEAVVDIGGGVIERATVTGVADQTAVGKKVYATGVNTFTLTETAFLGAVGEVTRWHAGTTADVLFYSAEAMGSVFGRVTRDEWLVGTVSTLALRSTTTRTIGHRRLGGYGRIRGIWAKSTGFHVGHNAGSMGLTFLLGTSTAGAATVITGGRVALEFTRIDASGDLGAVISGTAVTAASEFDEGSICFIRRSGATAFTATAPVTFEVWADVIRSAMD